MTLGDLEGSNEDHMFLMDYVSVTKSAGLGFSAEGHVTNSNIHWILVKSSLFLFRNYNDDCFVRAAVLSLLSKLNVNLPDQRHLAHAVLLQIISKHSELINVSHLNVIIHQIFFNLFQHEA